MAFAVQCKPLATRVAQRSAVRPVPSKRAFSLRVRAEAPEAPKVDAPKPEGGIVIPGATPKTVSLNDAMAFSGPAPEAFNGRMAMLGFVAAVGAELATGKSVATQFSQAPLAVLGVVAAFAVASLVPILKGADQGEAFGPLTKKAETINGRAAMLGIAALIAIELVKGSALL